MYDTIHDNRAPSPLVRTVAHPERHHCIALIIVNAALLGLATTPLFATA